MKESPLQEKRRKQGGEAFLRFLLYKRGKQLFALFLERYEEQDEEEMEVDEKNYFC